MDLICAIITSLFEFLYYHKWQLLFGVTLLVFWIRKDKVFPKRIQETFGGRLTEGNIKKIEFVKKGLVYIFSHDEFQGYERRPDREIDEKRIRKHFLKPNFEVVEPFVNLTADEVKNTLENVSSTKLQVHDCILVFFITQYNFLGRYLAKNGFYTEDDVTKWFKGLITPSLITKPKLFFFQASKARSNPLKITQNSMSYDGGSNASSFFSLPVDANLFIVRSSLSYITDEGGTWFVDELCKHLKGDMPLHEEIVNVVSSAKEKINQPNKKKGGEFSPDVTSTLTYKLYLNNKKKQTNQSLKVYEIKEEIGIVFIFNYNESYNKRKHAYECREGSKHDCKKMKKTFERLGFKVILEHDLDEMEVMSIIKQYKTDFNLYSSVVVAFFTHGYDGMLCTTGEEINPEKLFLAIKKYFEGKPKIFIFQTCRGKYLSHGVLIKKTVRNKSPSSSKDNNKAHVMDTSSTVHDTSYDSNKTYPILRIDDMLVLNSTFLGNASARNPLRGTWFIQELCAMIGKKTRKMASVSVLDIFIEVQRTVALKHHGERKQMPVYTSTLTKKILIGKID